MTFLHPPRWTQSVPDPADEPPRPDQIKRTAGVHGTPLAGPLVRSCRFRSIAQVLEVARSYSQGRRNWIPQPEGFMSSKKYENGIQDQAEVPKPDGADCRLAPALYFWTCWKVRPTAAPISWLCPIHAAQSHLCPTVDINRIGRPEERRPHREKHWSYCCAVLVSSERFMFVSLL